MYDAITQEKVPFFIVMKKRLKPITFSPNCLHVQLSCTVCSTRQL